MQPKGSGVVPLRAQVWSPPPKRPEFTQGGLAAASQNSFPEMGVCGVKFVGHVDKLDNPMHSIIRVKNFLA